jgi:ubiquinone/menaquinone biosynthesis C-methylase UbiE
MDFSEAKRFAAHFDDPARDAWQKPDEVVQLLSVTPGSTVVDLGAGTGYFLGRLSKAVGDGGQVLALDAEPQMVAYSEHRARETGWKNVVARQVPYESPELAPESVDRVLIVDTWHHISDREAYAAKLRTGLRPGGAVVIVDFTLESDVGPPASHRLAPERVVQELETAGLAARIVEETLPKQYVVRGDRR